MDIKYWCVTILKLLTISNVTCVFSNEAQKVVHNAGLEDFTKDEENDPKNQLKNQEFIRNIEHIKEHYKDAINFDIDKITPEELAFHFFKIHDTDGNSKLDGLELLAAIGHAIEEQFEDIEQDEKMDQQTKDRRVRTLQTRMWIAVDRILREDDTTNDGYLSYEEFAKSTRATKELRGEHFQVYVPKKQYGQNTDPTKTTS